MNKRIDIGVALALVDVLIHRQKVDDESSCIDKSGASETESDQEAVADAKSTPTPRVMSLKGDKGDRQSRPSADFSSHIAGDISRGAPETEEVDLIVGRSTKPVIPALEISGDAGDGPLYRPRRFSIATSSHITARRVSKNADQLGADGMHAAAAAAAVSANSVPGNEVLDADEKKKSNAVAAFATVKAARAMKKLKMKRGRKAGGGAPGLDEEVGEVLAGDIEQLAFGLNGVSQMLAQLQSVMVAHSSKAEARITSLEQSLIALAHEEATRWHALEEFLNDSSNAIGPKLPESRVVESEAQVLRPPAHLSGSVDVEPALGD